MTAGTPKGKNSGDDKNNLEDRLGAVAGQLAIYQLTMSHPPAVDGPPWTIGRRPSLGT